MTQTASGESSRGTAARVFPEKLAPLTRSADKSSLQIRKDGDVTRLTFSLSSETPVERWFGKEVLSHAKGAIRMDRIKSGAMPLLFNHDWNDPVGMIDDARVEDHVQRHLGVVPAGQRVAEAGALRVAERLRAVHRGHDAAALAGDDAHRPVQQLAHPALPRLAHQAGPR